MSCKILTYGQPVIGAGDIRYQDCVTWLPLANRTYTVPGILVEMLLMRMIFVGIVTCSSLEALVVCSRTELLKYLSRLSCSLLQEVVLQCGWLETSKDTSWPSRCQAAHQQDSYIACMISYLKLLTAMRITGSSTSAVSPVSTSELCPAGSAFRLTGVPLHNLNNFYNTNDKCSIMNAALNWASVRLDNPASKSITLLTTYHAYVGNIALNK